MPVTAKLSRKFYEKLGDEVANELVEWFNMVDSTYRSDLRELNELNFARFDAKLEQRVAELDVKIDRVATELDAKIDRVAAELDAMIDRVAAELDAKIDRVSAEIRADMQVGFARVHRRFAEMESRLTRRMFGFWIAQAATTTALVLAVVKIVGR
jgi:hypothetical protein